MQPKTYPPGSVRALLSTDLVTPPTRAALLARLAPLPSYTPRCFDAQQFGTLRAACDRLIPQAHRADPIDLAAAIDERLTASEGNGWRYAALPPDADAFVQGIQGLDETARALFGQGFVALDDEQQDAVLTAVQRGEAHGTTWTNLSPTRFFEELLTELCECYYSDPLTQEEIGYVGMADGQGWQQIGLDQREAHEPEALGEDV